MLAHRAALQADLSLEGDDRGMYDNRERDGDSNEHGDTDQTSDDGSLAHDSEPESLKSAPGRRRAPCSAPLANYGW